MGSSSNIIFSISFKIAGEENVFGFTGMTLMVLIWFIWTCLDWMSRLHEDGYIKDKEHLNSIIKDYKKKVDNSSYLLMSKYDELREFSDKDKLQRILKEFTEANSIIYSSQIYKYTIHMQKNITKIKLKYENGYILEGVDTNVILQAYYYINNEDYKDINNIVKTWRSINLDNKENEVHSENLSEKLTENILSFSKRIINHLNNKKNEDINDNDAVVYGALRMVLEYLFNSDEKQLKFSKILECEEKEELLFKMKRTGALCSILSESPYIFMNNGISSKKGRIYISLCININNVRYNILLSANNEILKRDSWQQCMREYAMQLENILQDEFDVISS